MTFHIQAFGCQMNVNEAAWLERALLAQGLKKAPPEKALVLIVMTCSVRDKPEQKVYSLLGRWRRFHRANPAVFAAVGGCVAQQIGAGFWERFPFVRLVFGTDGVANAPQAILKLLRGPARGGRRISLLDFSEEPVELPLHIEQRDEAAHKGQRFNDGRAYVNIMQGCNNFCAYCIVPYVRGRQKSRSAEAVLDECTRLAQAGVREITLLGQNVNSYGLDKAARKKEPVTFAELLRRVAAIEGVERVRFTTSHPKDLDAEVIKAFGQVPEVCPHLHLPLQSGSDSVLKAMGRKYDLARYLDIVRALRLARPDIALSTDIIVGFPGESETDFQATLDVLGNVEFDSSFSFMYSDRPGVRSEMLEPKVEQDVKAERLERLQKLQEELSGESLAKAVGSTVVVLLEGFSKMPSGHPEHEGGLAKDAVCWRGRDEYNRVVNIVSSPEVVETWRPGMMLEAAILTAKKHSLFGKAKGEPW